MHDNADRLLVEAALIGGDDGIEPRFIVGVAGNTISTCLLGSRTMLPLSRSRHWPTYRHGQAIGKTRRQFARDETRPVGFTDADMATDIAAE